MKKEFKNNWNLDFFYMSFTYDGLLIGIPNSEIDGMVLSDYIRVLKRLKPYDDIDNNINIIEKRNDNGLLKPIIIIFDLYKHEPSIRSLIITFCDINDSMENVINNTIEENDSNFKTTEWGW